jgi:beta-ureidopropionase
MAEVEFSKYPKGGHEHLADGTLGRDHGAYQLGDPDGQSLTGVESGGGPEAVWPARTDTCSTPDRQMGRLMRSVTIAITQTTWTGDKTSMLDKHEGFAREAAARGAGAICFQELFYGPYFGITEDQKYYDYAEAADGPVVQRFAALAKELALVMVLPIYEEEQAGVYYNTAVVVDSDGTVLGKYRKSHIPNLPNFWEKFYFRPGNLGYPVFMTAVGKVGVYICYDRHFPEGWRELGLNGAEIVFNPNASKPGLSARLWELEQPVAAGDNGYFVAVPNRVGREDNEYGDEAVEFYGTSYVVDPRGNFVGEKGSSTSEEVLLREVDLDLIRQVRNDWQFYRDRRPDSYKAIIVP